MCSEDAGEKTAPRQRWESGACSALLSAELKPLRGTTPTAEPEFAWPWIFLRNINELETRLEDGDGLVFMKYYILSAIGINASW